MNKTFKRIVHSILAVLAVIGFTTTAYFVTKNNAGMLSASILDSLSPAQICKVEFVTPKGSAYPSNGVVTIQSVNVTVDKAPAAAMPYCDGAGDVLSSDNVSGSDLEGSVITFENSLPACTNAVFSNNNILLPDTFSSACDIKITVPGTLPLITSTKDLTIEPISCAALKTSMLRGYGEGFENIALGDLGSFAKSTNAFNFSTATAISSIDLNYPVTAVEGAKTFQIHLSFVPDISVDPINGVDGRAKITANNNNGVYEIKVRNEGADTVQTALNFAYVFNDLMGSDSPFIAYPDGTDPKIVLLQATEMGAHPNAVPGPGYVCLKNGGAVASCFSGGANGLNEGAGVLTTPLKLDNEVVQGESALVFAAESAGEIRWISSHPSILEVASLSEVDQQDKGTADFVDTTIGVAGLATPGLGSYNIADCDKDYDDNFDPPKYVGGTETCTVTAKVPVEFDISTKSYTVNVAIGDEIVPVTVKGDKLTGFLEGTGTYTSSAGVSMPLTGPVTGVVSGSVSGTYSGTVTGTVTATVQATGQMGGLATEITITDFTGAFAVVAISPGTLTDVPTFTTTVKKQEDDISHVGIIFAKRPGTSILSVIDKQGCIASFEVEVIKKQVILQMVGRDSGDVLDVSDTVQINAFAGGANSEMEEYENITAASGIEWFSSNEEVASVDGTGLLTALKPGVTNITARYDTGDAEIGAIESVPLQVTVNKITGLRVTFNKATEDKLPAEVVDNAHKSVIIAIHNSTAAGQTFLVEGQSVSIALPTGTYSNDISKVVAITTDLATKIAALDNGHVGGKPLVPGKIVKVTTIDGYPGMLILQPLNQDGTDYDENKIEDIDENGIIDIGTTALETDVAILPTYNNAIPLPASETYGLQVIAQYDNGATKLLPPTEFKWVNTPNNYLEQASLDTGLIKLGQLSGTSTVVAQYENADASVVRSNYLTITVDSGPVIEYVRRIGSGSVTKGSRILLQTKITDINTIANISDIGTSLVYSTFNTYQQINEDSSAIWFSATPFLSEITVVEETPAETTTTPPAEGTATTEGTTTTTQPAPAPVSSKFKTYNIPIEIPVDQNLFNGIYKLILSITDAENHTLNYVYPIRIGEIGAGDVDGNGVTNMIDVILAFQIASGLNPTPTPAELQAANVDGIGGVNLVDVILLFNRVTNK